MQNSSAPPCMATILAICLKPEAVSEAHPRVAETARQACSALKQRRLLCNAKPRHPTLRCQLWPGREGSVHPRQDRMGFPRSTEVLHRRQEKLGRAAKATGCHQGETLETPAGATREDRRKRLFFRSLQCSLIGHRDSRSIVAHRRPKHECRLPQRECPAVPVLVPALVAVASVISVIRLDTQQTIAHTTKSHARSIRTLGPTTVLKHPRVDLVRLGNALCFREVAVCVSPVTVIASSTRFALV